MYNFVAIQSSVLVVFWQGIAPDSPLVRYLLMRKAYSMQEAAHGEDWIGGDDRRLAIRVGRGCGESPRARDPVSGRFSTTGVPGGGDLGCRGQGWGQVLGVGVGNQRQLCKRVGPKGHSQP